MLGGFIYNPPDIFNYLLNINIMQKMNPHLLLGILIFLSSASISSAQFRVKTINEMYEVGTNVDEILTNHVGYKAEIITKYVRIGYERTGIFLQEKMTADLFLSNENGTARVYIGSGVDLSEQENGTLLRTGAQFKMTSRADWFLNIEASHAFNKQKTLIPRNELTVEILREFKPRNKNSNTRVLLGIKGKAVRSRGHYPSYLDRAWNCFLEETNRLGVVVTTSDYIDFYTGNDPYTSTAEETIEYLQNFLLGRVGEVSPKLAQFSKSQIVSVVQCVYTGMEGLGQLWLGFDDGSEVGLTLTGGVTVHGTKTSTLYTPSGSVGLAYRFPNFARDLSGPRYSPGSPGLSGSEITVIGNSIQKDSDTRVDSYVINPFDQFSISQKVLPVEYQVDATPYVYGSIMFRD
ncbi:MAG: hypothetical protein ACI83D_000285 [Planctomycetota bacterium]|jgi:hypothetical protein